jgi:N-terminal domain of unknown function (DUF4140)
MLRLIAAVLLASVAPMASVAPVLAADITAPSRIDAVTVYPGVATVTRVVEVEVPAGQHTLVVAGLPQALDPNSLRVDGVAVGQLQIGACASSPRTRPARARNCMASPPSVT